MAEMVRIGNKICSKEYGYPYAVLEENETWYLYDHIKNSGTYAKVKEIWTGTTEQDIDRVKEALIRWGGGLMTDLNLLMEIYATN